MCCSCFLIGSSPCIHKLISADFSWNTSSVHVTCCPGQKVTLTNPRELLPDRKWPSPVHLNCCTGQEVTLTSSRKLVPDRKWPSPVHLNCCTEQQVTLTSSRELVPDWRWQELELTINKLLSILTHSQNC